MADDGVKKKREIIIIGGGLAGLSAANTLLKHKDKFKVTLLEGNSSLGGRIKTLKFPEGNDCINYEEIAMGSSYFHGTEGNSIYRYYYDKCKVDPNEIKYPLEDIKVQCIFSDGRIIPPYIVNELQHCLESLEDREAILTSPLAEESLYDYLRANFLPKIKDIVTTHKLEGYDVISLFEGFLAYDSINEGSKYVRDISCSSVVDWEYLDGDECLFITGNPYQRVIDYLSSSLPKDIIKLNTTVTSIDWSVCPINVTVSNGYVYSADHVIVTVSLGALKRFVHEDFFVPSLPYSKLQAIDRIGFGLVNKIILQFEGPLFDGQYFTVRIHWTQKDKGSSLLKTHPWLSGLHYIEQYPTHSQTCCYYIGWLCGEDALAIEQISAHTLIQVLCGVFKRSFGEESPHLLDVRVSNWSKGFSYGSYSYTPPGESSDTLRQELARPLEGNRVLFAGEATCSSQYSCAHPAYDTGVKVAQNIINSYE